MQDVSDSALVVGIGRWRQDALAESYRRHAGAVFALAPLVGAGAYLAGIAVAMWLLPAVDETPAGFPADDLYAFRLTALGTQLVLWTTTAVVFAWLAGRLLDPTPSVGVLRRNARAYTGLSAVR